MKRKFLPLFALFLVSVAGWWIWRSQARRAALETTGPHGWGRRGYDLHQSRCYRPSPSEGGAREGREGRPDQTRSSPVVLSQAASMAGLNVLTGDVNGDGRMEVVGMDSQARQLQVWDGHLKRLAQTDLGLDPHLHCVADMDGDGIDEVAVDQVGAGLRASPADCRQVTFYRAIERGGKRKEEEGRGGKRGSPSLPSPSIPFHPLSLQPVHSLILPRSEIDCDESGMPRSIFPSVTPADLDGDGRTEVILARDFPQPGEKISRRVSAYRLDSDRELWHYDLGPWVDSLAVTDLQGDGKLDVLVGTYAVSNGVEANGTDDSHCYVIALSGDGRPLWRTEPLAGHFSFALVAVEDLQGDGEPEVVVSTATAYPHRTDKGKLFLLDPRSGKEIVPYYEAEASCSLCHPAIGDVRGNRRREIVVGGGDGQIRVFDGQLQLLAAIPCGSPVAVRGLADLNGDGKAEIIGMTADFRVVVAHCTPGYLAPTLSTYRLLAGLEPLQSLPELYTQVIVTDLDGQDPPELLVSAVRGPTVFSETRVLTVSSRRPTELATPPVRLTLTGGRVREFAWSPDGEQLAILVARGEKAAGGDVGVLSVETGAVQWLTRWGDCSGLTWSPKNGRMAFLRTSRRNLEGQGDVWVAADGSSRPVQLTHDGHSARPTWRPDGKRLIFCSDREGTWDLYEVDVAGGRLPRPLSLANTRENDELCPAYSPNGKQLAFLRREKVSIRQEKMRVHKGKFVPLWRLYLLDCDQNRLWLVTSDSTLRQAVQSPPNGFDPLVVDLWLKDQQMLPCVCLGDSPSELLAGDWSAAWEGRSQALAFSLAVARLHPDGWILNTPTDLWYWHLDPDLSRASLWRLSVDDDLEESHPYWSLDGRWLAFEGLNTERASPRPEVWLSERGRLASKKLTDGERPQWRPHHPTTLAFLRDGEVWQARLKNPVPPPPPGPWWKLLPYMAGGLVGLFLAGLAATLHLPGRVTDFSRKFLWTWRTARATNEFTLLREVARTLEKVGAALHPLKDVVNLQAFVDMEGEGEEALRTSLGHCLSPKNVQAAARLLKGLQEHLRQLLLDEKAIKGLLRSQSEEVRERFGRALDALLDNKVLLARYGARLVEQAETFAVLSERPAERQRAFLRRTAQDLQGFYQLIGEKGEEGPGLRPILSQALKTLSVASVLERAQETVDARAAHHHIRIVGPDHLNPYLRIAGDPAPLTQTLADLLGNAVDAVVEQITLAPRDYIGKVRLEVKEEDHLIIVRIADNGCGIPPDLLEPIQHKESVSTKGHGRGMGLVNARRTLERYPGGKFEITSPGVGQGAVVTLRLEKL